MRQKDILDAIEACKRLADEQRARSESPIHPNDYRASFLNYLAGFLRRGHPAIAKGLEAVIEESYRA